MVSQPAPTTGQPANTPASLRAQIEATNVSLSDALARRAGIQARIDAAGGPGERVRLRNGELRGVEGEITRIRAQLAGLEAELQQREATAANPSAPPAFQPAPPTVPVSVAPPSAPPASTTVPPGPGLDINSMVLGGGITVLVLLPLLFAITWRAGRRAALAARHPEWDGDTSRLARMEEAIGGIAVEVERLSESQAFLTNALVADGRQKQVREELGARR